MDFTKEASVKFKIDRVLGTGEVERWTVSGLGAVVELALEAPDFTASDRELTKGTDWITGQSQALDSGLKTAMGSGPEPMKGSGLKLEQEPIWTCRLGREPTKGTDWMDPYNLSRQGSSRRMQRPNTSRHREPVE